MELEDLDSFNRAYATVDTLTPQIDQELAYKELRGQLRNCWSCGPEGPVSAASTEPISAVYDNVDTSPDGVGAILFGTANGNINELNTGVPGIAKLVL